MGPNEEPTEEWMTAAARYQYLRGPINRKAQAEHFRAWGCKTEHGKCKRGKYTTTSPDGLSLIDWVKDNENLFLDFLDDPEMDGVEWEPINVYLDLFFPPQGVEARGLQSKEVP